MKAFEQRLADLQADVVSLQDPLQNLLKMLDLSPAQLEIYMEQNVNDGNLLDFFDLIEKRTRFFIDQYLDINNRFESVEIDYLVTSNNHFFTEEQRILSKMYTTKLFCKSKL